MHSFKCNVCKVPKTYIENPFLFFVTRFGLVLYVVMAVLLLSWSAVCLFGWWASVRSLRTKILVPVEVAAILQHKEQHVFSVY